MKGIIFGFILVVLLIAFLKTISMKETSFINYVAPFAPKSHKNWWRRDGWARFGYPYYSYWENFENLNDKPAAYTDDSEDSSLLAKKANSEKPVMEYAPDTPGPADLYNNQPYHLLADEMGQPRDKESISCVNSRSCYATDFQRMIDKTGNFRQMTNNYKRNYPDSCSSPYQELVLNFYKADPMAVPQNNTGGSVSEATYG
jgi:hypothetical protein